MAKKVWSLCKTNVFFWVLTITSLALLITSFIIPPSGEIHPSVLQGAAEIEVWGVLYIVLKALERGADATLTHNNTSITLNNPDNKDKDGIDG